MASSDTGSDPVVVESDEENHSQETLDLENNFKWLKKERNICWLFFHIGENDEGKGPDKTKVHCNFVH